MEKKIWSKPEISVVEFTSGDYCTSSCLAAYSGYLYCALPNDPNKIGDYNYHQDEVFNEPNGWMGANGNANHGSCNDAAYFSCEGNNSFGVESNTGADVWNVQIGEELTTDPYNTSLGYQWPGLDIGELTSSLTSEFIGTGKWFKATWHSGDRVNGGTWRHFGLALINSVTVDGDPNRS